MSQNKKFDEATLSEIMKELNGGFPDMLDVVMNFLKQSNYSTYWLLYICRRDKERNGNLIPTSCKIFEPGSDFQRVV